MNPTKTIDSADKKILSIIRSEGYTARARSEIIEHLTTLVSFMKGTESTAEGDRIYAAFSKWEAVLHVFFHEITDLRLPLEHLPGEPAIVTSTEDEYVRAELEPYCPSLRFGEKEPARKRDVGYEVAYTSLSSFITEEICVAARPRTFEDKRHIYDIGILLDELTFSRLQRVGKPGKELVYYEPLGPSIRFPSFESQARRTSLCQR